MGRRGGGGCGGPAELSSSTAGQEASQDERGGCALLSTQLNALLGERPVTHREAQGHESDEFMGYFPRGITYQVWGWASPLSNERRPWALG